MGVISARLRKESIIIDPPEMEKEPLFRHLVETLASVHKLEDPELLYESVLKREAMVSTCIGFGCAVPHCHSDQLDKTYFAAARLNPPRDFETPDDEPVSLMFLMAGPKKNTGLHIKLLSKLSRLLHDPEFRKSLQNARDAEDFYNLLCQKDT